MTVTVHKLDGRWWFDQDASRPIPPCVTHIIHVPDDSYFIDLFDATRPDVPLHALTLQIHGARHCPLCDQVVTRALHFNADILIEIAESKRWDGIKLVSTIV